MTIEITQYEPKSWDIAGVGDRLTAFTLSKGGPDYDPLTMAFKAAVDGKVVGDMIAISLWGRVEVNLFEVRPEARGLGIGTYMMKTVEEFARASGAAGIHLWTPTWQGEGFYERQGYKELGRLPLKIPGHFDNKPQFQIFYHKELEP